MSTQHTNIVRAPAQTPGQHIPSLRHEVLAQLRDLHCTDPSLAYTLVLEQMLSGLTPQQAAQRVRDHQPALFAATLGDAAAALVRASCHATPDAIQAVLTEANNFSRTCDEAVRWLIMRGHSAIRWWGPRDPGDSGGSAVPAPDAPTSPAPLTCAACVPAPAPEEVTA